MHTLSRTIKAVILFLSILSHLIIVVLFNWYDSLLIQDMPRRKSSLEQSTQARNGNVVMLFPLQYSLEDSEDNKNGNEYTDASGRKCNRDKIYQGIGIIYDTNTKLIISAPDYYPGYKAGLRLDDYIVNAELKIINNRMGIEVIRGNASFRFDIKVEDICSNKK